MSWRRLLAMAAVIVLVYGSADVVFSTAVPHPTPAGGRSDSGSDNEELLAPSPTMPELSAAEAEACGIPSDGPVGQVYACAVQVP